MAIHHEAPPDARPRLSTAGTVARLILIGIALAEVAGTFAYLGGWLTPNALTPARFTDGFEEVNGVHPGFRRNHAKGVGVSGFFESNGNGVRLSEAAVFQPGRVPVLGRFSLGGGQPYAPDTASTVRGLGLQVSLPDGESTPVRWILTPAQPLKTENAATPSQDKNFLFDTLIAQMHRRPLQWYLTVIVGQPGDPSNDATIAWPAGREQVNVGTLTLDRVESDDTSAARDINFDPLVLPDGMAPSDDPLLSARSAVYSQSYTRRSGEPKQPSAITPAEVGKGLSAARYPVMLFGSVHLPFILPHDALLYAILRRTHTVLAFLLFLSILAHFGAILFHTLIVRDGMLLRMVPWNRR